MEDAKNRSILSVNSGDLDQELNYSDEEGERKERKVIKKKRPERVYHQEVDTNVYQIEFSTLKDEAELATGDPLICQTCQAIFNSLSKIKEVDQIGYTGQIWECEFCNTKNKVNLEPEEMPKTDKVNYILEAAAQVQDKELMG